MNTPQLIFGLNIHKNNPPMAKKSPVAEHRLPGFVDKNQLFRIWAYLPQMQNLPRYVPG